jgi:hypothetical protein
MKKHGKVRQVNKHCKKNLTIRSNHKSMLSGMKVMMGSKMVLRVLRNPSLN